MTDDIAIVHEQYSGMGGAQRVANELGEIFDAPIYTAFATDEIAANNPRIRELFNNSWITKWIRRGGPARAVVRDLYYQLAWSRVPDLAGYDTLIQSGPGPMWYVPPDDQTVVRYIHTPPRHIYSAFQSTEGSFLMLAFTLYLRAVRSHTISYAEKYVANSELVARRISKYWGVDRDSIAVVYPPVDVDSYEPGAEGKFYVAVSRLVEHKGFEAVVDAFSDLPSAELRIVGDGPEREALENRAARASNIKFEGYVSEERKRSLLADAKASVYNALNEDFGLVPVESWAAGTPVIGVHDGFTQYQLEDGVTGIVFDRGDTNSETAANIRDAVERFEADGVETSPAELHERATAFSSDQFAERMRDVVRESREESAITPAFME